MSNNTFSHESFLRSEQALLILDALRKGAELQSLNLGGLSADDKTYLEAEDCVRSALYSQLELKIHSGTSTWVKKLVTCYRDLFTQPQRALDSIDDLEANCPSHLDLQLRLKFWRAHLNLLLGKIETGKRELLQIASTIPDGIWRNEMLAIRALGYYFTGRTRDALSAHYECQKSIDANPDLFLQTFDCGMAARTALKLCNPASFEYFTQRLDASLIKKDDSRYRLRHTGYRAMIFNQLGEHDTAELHWKIADEQLHSTESAIERGQYLVFRGMSHSIINDISKANRAFELAEHELKLAGSPSVYLVELDIAKKLSLISNPTQRSLNLRASLANTESAYEHFLIMAKTHQYPAQTMYAESAEFCNALAEGRKAPNTADGRQSLVLSVIENISTSTTFAQGLSHFRLIPDFVHEISESDLSISGLENAIESVLKIKPTIIDGQFHFSGQLNQLETEPQVKTILAFASSLYSLGAKAKELFKAQSRLREAIRTKHLLHDVRFFAQELSKQSKSLDPKVNLSKLSDDLNHLIESYLKALKDGANPSQPSIVNFPNLLAQIVQTTGQITGKAAEIPAHRPLPFLWISEVLLKRLLLNLIKNGIEAGTGKTPVSISYKIDDTFGREKLVIYVSDNGPGLDPALIDQLLQGDTACASTKISGIGLGLQSALECAKDVGADISVVPTTRVTGTTFKVCIPLPRSNLKSGEPEILVIDDSDAVRDAWYKFGELEQLHVESVYGEDAVAALNHLSKATTWVVLDYDLKLPNCTGADLAPAIIKLGTKVALSTGFLESELPAEVIEVPWHAILTKEPQYPVEHKRNVIPLPFRGRPAITVEPESAATIRHDIKNELTPLRIAIKALTQNLPDDRYVKLIECSVKGIEKIVKQKEA
jgi:signal transduction histidine kinase